MVLARILTPDDYGIMAMVVTHRFLDTANDEARSRLAQERPNARMVLRQKFSFMSADERRDELSRAQEALSTLDLADQIGDSREEEPFERDYRITLEETIKMLTTDPELGMG